MKRLSHWVRPATVLIVIGLLSLSCASEAGPSAAPIETAEPVETADSVEAAGPVETPGSESASGDYAISGLADGTHIGIAAFSPPPAELATTWQSRWNDANRSASIGRRQLDWIDIEPSEGDYQLAELNEQLASITDLGQAPMITIAAVDTSGTPFPGWLGDTFDPSRAGAAYNRMLDAVAPSLQKHGVWLLAIANEPPLDDGLDPTEFGQFVEIIERHGNDVLPQTAIGFTFAGDDFFRNDPAAVNLIEVVDVVSVNHYCLRPDLTAIDLSDTAANINALQARAGNKPLIFQELGCPASELVGSSEDFQASWFGAAFTAIRNEPQIRAAFVFELVDWSPELIGADYGELTDAEPELAAFWNRFNEWLLTTGLVRGDMTTRPAFDVYLEELEG